jgi:phage terminase large subunit
MYKKGMSNSDMAKEMKRLKVGSSKTIVGDSAEPKTISELKSYGFNIRGAKKGADSIKHGIALLQDYEMLVTSNSLNLIKELRHYAWNDKKANVTIDNYNHLIDGMRYLATEKLSNRSDSGEMNLAEKW